MSESTCFPVKSKTGETSDCEILPLVELAQFGEERTVVVDVVKSPPTFLFVVVAHPAGRSGAVTESKFLCMGMRKSVREFA